MQRPRSRPAGCAGAPRPLRRSRPRVAAPGALAPRPLRRGAQALLVGLCLAPALAGPLRAEMADATYLLDLHAGSDHADLVRRASRGGFALSDGTPVSLRRWYSPETPQLTLRMLTEVSEGFGLTWGLSSGEQGPKYRIAPAIHLGFILQHHLAPNATLSLSGGTLLGGGLRELPCQADYGAFGVMEVNCRLAASTLPPEQTLEHLLDVSGSSGSWLAVAFDWRF